MARYLILWEIDPARVPTDVKERGTAWLVMVEMMKADMKKGVTKDWGAFTAEHKGYAIQEGNEVSLMTELGKYTPYIKFEVRPVATLAQVEEAVKASMK